MADRVHVCGLHLLGDCSPEPGRARPHPKYASERDLRGVDIWAVSEIISMENKTAEQSSPGLPLSSYAKDPTAHTGHLDASRTPKKNISSSRNTTHFDEPSRQTTHLNYFHTLDSNCGPANCPTAAPLSRPLLQQHSLLHISVSRAKILLLPQRAAS